MAKFKKLPSNWKWKGEVLKQEDIEDWYGFIYLIEDLENNKKYIGEKSFWSFKVPKGKSNKKKVPSDWEKYESSNAQLKDLVKESKEYKHDKFKFTILALCKDKSVMKLVEARWILGLGALMSKDYYNANIRITVLNSYDNYNERVEELDMKDFL